MSLKYVIRSALIRQPPSRISAERRTAAPRRRQQTAVLSRSVAPRPSKTYAPQNVRALLVRIYSYINVSHVSFSEVTLTAPASSEESHYF